MLAQPRSLEDSDRFAEMLTSGLKSEPGLGEHLRQIANSSAEWFDRAVVEDLCL